MRRSVQPVVTTLSGTRQSTQKAIVQAIASARKQQLEDFLWKKNYTSYDVASVQRIYLHESPLLEGDFPGFHLWARVFIENGMKALFPNAVFEMGPSEGVPSTGLHILFFHPRLPQIQVPEIYLLINVFDIPPHQPWIHQYNIYLFSKAYRVLDAKYANLRGYATHPRIASQTYYLPLISPLQETNTSTPTPTGSIQKIYISPPQTERQRLYVTLLSAMVSSSSIQITHDLREEGIQGILYILADEANSLYPTWQMEYALHLGLHCICEKSPADIYHENYYFDKVIFVDRLHPSNLSALVQRISLLTTPVLKIDRSKDLARNLLQWRKVLGLGLL